MSITADANFSDLIQKPTATVARLRGRPRIRLYRRDDEDLILTTASRYDQEREVITAVSRMFLYLAHVDADAAAKLAVEAFPWITLLPTEDVREFVGEFIRLLRASEDIDNLAPVLQMIVEWRHTAEAYADPGLLSALTATQGDFGPVPEPVVS
jgi:hypothetical protein